MPPAPHLILIINYEDHLKPSSPTIWIALQKVARFARKCIAMTPCAIVHPVGDEVPDIKTTWGSRGSIYSSLPSYLVPATTFIAESRVVHLILHQLEQLMRYSSCM